MSDRSELADRRSDYDWGSLDRADLDDDPIAQWWTWYDAAVAAGALEPNAMSVATIAADGGPDARVVLARGVDQRGFAFYTNLESAKAQHLAARPQAAATFVWLELHRQVRLRGAVEQVDGVESDAYYASRPRASRIGAWASPQPRPAFPPRTCPARPTGAACASSRSRSSSGRGARAASTTASATAASTKRGGKFNVSGREVTLRSFQVREASRIDGFGA